MLFWMAGAALVVAAELGADLEEVTGVQWPRFDPKTGKKMWMVTAEKAWSDGGGNLFHVKEPKVIFFGSEYKINVTSKRGVVKREGRRAFTFLLEGDVTVRVSDPGKTVVRAEKLEWLAAQHVLRSDSPVEIERTDLIVKGVGLELRPQKGDEEVNFIQLKKDVKATISPHASSSAIFSSITGKVEKNDPAQKDGPPLFISSSGPMTINRDTSIVSFEKNVEVRRESFRIRCEDLRMSFDPGTRKVKDIHGSGNLKAFDGENGASGDALSWDALSGLVEIIGKPAKTWRAAATVSAPVIWFSQKDGKILWTGGAQIYAPSEGPASLMHFGGAGQ